MIWNCGSYKFDTRMPIVMGILNVTPDSFSDGGSYAGEDEAVRAFMAKANPAALRESAARMAEAIERGLHVHHRVHAQAAVDRRAHLLLPDARERLLGHLAGLVIGEALHHRLVLLGRLLHVRRPELLQALREPELRPRIRRRQARRLAEERQRLGRSASAPADVSASARA